MAWTDPHTWVANELVTDTLLNTHLRDNLIALKTPPGAIGQLDEADLTTTSTSFVNVLDTEGKFKHTLTIAGDTVIAFANLVVYHNTANAQIAFNISVDNVDYFADDGLISVRTTDFSNVMRVPVSFFVRLSGLTPGSRIFRLRWKTNTATATLYTGSGATSMGDVHPQFGVYELLG